MTLLKDLRQRRWVPVLGAALFVGMMSAGYYYNLTFVQLGLKDLGERVLGMDSGQVALYMALLAGLTCLVSLLVGYAMKRTGLSASFFFKLRLAFFVVLAQTALTAAVPFLVTPNAFLVWIVCASLALGVGVPAMFGLTVDLIPRPDRGYAAAAITALAYFFAAAFSGQWQIENFASSMLVFMLPGCAAFGFLAFAPLPFTRQLAQQHRRPEYAWGRFVRRTSDGRIVVQRRLFIIVALMFGIFFVDSLGFLRLLDTPIYIDSSWQSPLLGIRLFIAVVHVNFAVVGGILYTRLHENNLFIWIFGIFTLVHFMYRLDARLGGDAPLGMPMLYAIAVSLYTVVNFAIWADLSTPATISFNTAVGVSLSGWTATFLSTAVAIQFQFAGMPLENHLQIVNSLAMLFFTLLLFIQFIGTSYQKRSPS
jgi:MFS family permease